MTHPSEIELSLFAGGDVSWRERWRIQRHLRRCSSCENSVERFKTAASVLQDSLAEFPSGINWDRLAQEMTGNIRVGLAAGECVNEAPVARNNPSWRVAAVVCSAACLLMAAWYLNFPTPHHPTGIALLRTAEGIELKQGAASLMILNERTSQPVISSSTPNQLRTRFVDDETNQVTITDVYAQ